MYKKIHLDTNALIAGLDPEQPLAESFRLWRKDKVTLEVSAMAWAEFLCGPVNQDIIKIWQSILTTPPIPLDGNIASKAAALFNLNGRRSRSLPDCIVAATAIDQGAALCTLNHADFTRLTAHGLKLV